MSSAHLLVLHRECVSSVQLVMLINLNLMYVLIQNLTAGVFLIAVYIALS